MKIMCALACASAALLTVAMAATPADKPDPVFKGLKYRSIGPFRGGRSLTVAGIPGDYNTYYFGAVGGGVWKSTDGALSWSSIFDKEGTSAIGSIAIAPSDPNTVYVGTGEAALRGNISHGDGVYKSLDGGKTWKHIGLRDTRAISKILVNPRNPDIVFVAAMGHQYGPNPDRGVFRSTDGGKTWDKVLYKDENTGAIDLSFDPNNPNILFAGMWQAKRAPYTIESGGPGSGLYRSADGGTTWKQLEGSGLPKGPWGKVGVVVAANSDRVYALIQAAQGGLYRSDDGGSKWELVNASRELIQRAWYYMHIFADPKNPELIYILDVQFFKSTDGGHTFNRLHPPHGDNHALWIDPANTQRIITGDDGGASVSLNGGKSWTPQSNQPTAQFYHVITDNRFPYYVYGAQQDNSTVAIASRSDSGRIDRPDWYPVGGGESGYIAPDPRDPNIVYAGGYEGEVTRFDKRTGQTQEISPWPDVTDGEGAANLKHRFQWTAPLLISPHDPNVLYHAGEQLFKTTDGGMHWQAISPDLTRNDKTKQQTAGGPIDKDDTGTEYYDTIFAVIESPLAKGQIWVGTDDGLIQLTRDGGKTWANVTPKEMPEWGRVSLIDASPFDPGTAYAAVDCHQLDDLRPYIFKTNDYGKSWTKITQGIPDTTFARAVREDPKRRGLLYAGTETGVYVSFDDGVSWRSLQLNLPTTPVHDLVVKDNDLVVATHGRSFWILDDISPLREFNDTVPKEEVHLYKPGLAWRIRGGDGGPGGKGGAYGENPPAGAIIYFYCKAAPKGEASLEILDAAGRHVRGYSSKDMEPLTSPPDVDAEKPKKQFDPEEGLNRFVWDFRSDWAPRVPGYYLFDYESGSHGVLSLPGKYQVKLTVNGKSYTAPFEVKLDPRVKTSEADVEKQYQMSLRIHRDLSQVYTSVLQMQNVREQLKGLRERLAPGDPAAKAVAAAADDLDKKISAVEAELIDLRITASEDSLAYPLGLDGKLATLAMMVEGDADAAPTEPDQELFAMLASRLDTQLSKWSGLTAREIPAFVKLAEAQNLRTIVVPAAAVFAGGEGQR